MYFTYIIESLKNKRRYIGSTKNIEKRLRKHNQGGNKSTKPYKPYKLIYLESFASKADAIKREGVLKSYKGGKALQLLILSWGAGVDNRNSL